MSVRPTPPTTRQINALADGSLCAAERACVQSAVDASPELRAAVLAQRRVLDAIELTLGPAPLALRGRIASPRAPAPATAPRRPRRRLLSAAVASAAVAVAVAVWLAIMGGSSPSPTVVQAASLGQRPVQAAVPVIHGNSVTLPGLRAAGLPYPSWQNTFGFRATGMRRDTVGGRSATTVFYRDRAGERIAYTIISGPALPAGARTADTVLDGVWLSSLVTRRAAVVSWLRDGHTCVLSGAPKSLPVLQRLAAWGDAAPAVYERGRSASIV